MSIVQYRKATPADYADILRLQAANFIANLSEEEHQGGFLLAQFTAEQIARGRIKGSGIF